MTSRTEYSTQTPNKPSLFDVEYLRNHPTLDIGVLGYIGIVWPKEHSPEIRSFPPGAPVYIICMVGLNDNLHLTIACLEWPCDFHTPFELWIVILNRKDYSKKNITLNGKIEIYLKKDTYKWWATFFCLWEETKDGMFWTL